MIRDKTQVIVIYTEIRHNFIKFLRVYFSKKLHWSCKKSNGVKKCERDTIIQNSRGQPTFTQMLYLEDL